MDGERGGAEDAQRESAAFDVSVEDYRRAFAWAIATVPQAPPPTLAQRFAAARAYWVVGTIVGVLGSVVWAVNNMVRFAMPPWEVAVEVVPVTLGVALAMMPAALAVSVFQNWDARGWQRRFPRERAAWKRPGRMRISWDAAGLMLTGPEGFRSFRWNMIHAWLDAPEVLVIFTAPFDPVPVPHGTVSADDLNDLRHRLHDAGAPQYWQSLSSEVLGLKRVFD